MKNDYGLKERVEMLEQTQDILKEEISITL